MCNFGSYECLVLGLAGVGVVAMAMEVIANTKLYLVTVSRSLQTFVESCTIIASTWLLQLGARIKPIMAVEMLMNLLAATTKMIPDLQLLLSSTPAKLMAPCHSVVHSKI
jgi:hypothetical protein